MKLGDRVYILSGLEVEEGEIYMPSGVASDVPGTRWIKRDGRLGTRYAEKDLYLTLDQAVSNAMERREKEIKALASRLVRLALNSNIKVRLMKAAKLRPPKST